MSLHAILETIRISGEAKAQELEIRAYTQAGEILANAQLDAEGIQAQACASALEPASKARARIIHRARLESLQLTGNTRKELVDAALEQTHGRLAGIRTDPIYPTVLRRLLQEALSELDRSGQETRQDQPAIAACLEADPRDQPLLERLLQEIELDLQVSYLLECWGGLIASSQNGRIVAINTLEARLEKITPYLRSYLAALFEAEQLEIDRNQAFAWKTVYEPK